ncbi:unnamed protein product, partial [marine sediment metagenome]
MAQASQRKKRLSGLLITILGILVFALMVMFFFNEQKVFYKSNTLLERGSTFLQAGNLDAAEEAFKKALAIEPDSSRAHLRL